MHYFKKHKDIVHTESLCSLLWYSACKYTLDC